MERNHSNTEAVHSDEIDAIIGKPPGKLVRFGTISFIAIIVLIFAVTWIIEYPDKVTGACTLYARNAPKPVVPRTNSRLAKLYVKEGQSVKQSDVLGLLQSTTDYQELQELEKELIHIRESLITNNWSFLSIALPNYKHLGEMQAGYQTFYTEYIKVNAFIQSGLFENKKRLLRQELSFNDSLKHVLLKQKKIYEQDYVIAENDYQAKKKLFDEKVIASAELKREESNLLVHKLPIESLEASLFSNQSTAIGKSKELLDLENQYAELTASFSQSVNKLISDIQAWKYEHLLLSPSAGTATFPNMVQENQEVVMGKELFYIEDPKNECFVVVIVDQTNFGKIRKDQWVNIRLPSYPFQEYGFLVGKVETISRMPNIDKQYAVNVSLSKGLLTSNGNEIAFNNELQADAEIITQKTKLIKKFLYTLEGYFKKTDERKKKESSKVN